MGRGRAISEKNFTNSFAPIFFVVFNLLITTSFNINSISRTWAWVGLAKKVTPVKMTFKMLVELLKFLQFLFKFIFRYYYVVLNSNSIARWDHSLPLWGLFLIGKNTGTSLCAHQCFLLIESLSKPSTTTRSEQFSYLSCLHTNKFILLSIFSLVQMISLKIWETPVSWHCRMWTSSFHLWLKNVACLSSLIIKQEPHHRDWNCSA